MQLQDILEHFLLVLREMLPKVVGAFIVLGTGWIIGRLLGKAFSKFIRITRVEAPFRKTLFGKILDRSGWSLSGFFDIVARWFVYVCSILIAINVLGIDVLEPITSMAFMYLPMFIGGLFIFILGMLLSDFLADLVETWSNELKIAYTKVFVLSLRLFMYFMVTTVALVVMKIDVSILYIFANALAWGLAVGIAAGLGIALGWGFKDVVAKNAEKWIGASKAAVEKIEGMAEVEALRARVEELESSLAEQKESFEKMERTKAAIIAELTKPVTDLPSRLTELVGEKGQVLPVYGGYQITVLDPLEFPWTEVIIVLINRGFDIWFSRDENYYIIKCKSSSES